MEQLVSDRAQIWKVLAVCLLGLFCVVARSLLCRILGQTLGFSVSAQSFVVGVR
jgi:hypothetical protein